MKLETGADYSGTKRSARDLEDSLSAMLDRERGWPPTKSTAAILEEARMGTSPSDFEREVLLHRAIQSGIENELYCRYRDLAAYEAEHSGPAGARVWDDGQDVGWDLIRARIASGLRQVDVADRLGIAEEELRRLEANRYVDGHLDLLQ